MNASAAVLDQDEIQGNILAGLNKDFASFLFFALPGDQDKAKAWLADIVDEVATPSKPLGPQKPGQARNTR